MIDPKKTYRIRDGRPVRIYAKHEGQTGAVHGAVYVGGIDGWRVHQWESNGVGIREALDLVEVTLADELRDQIPWEALRPDIRYVAMDADSFSHRGRWWGFREEPLTLEDCDGWMLSPDEPGSAKRLDAVIMPEVDSDRWAETLIARPTT